MLERIQLSDNPNIISDKKTNIKDFIEKNRKELFDAELEVITSVMHNIKDTMPSETFSGKSGRLLYVFTHDGRHKDDVYISPKIYLTKDNTIVYKVFNPEKYKAVSPGANILTDAEGSTYCEVNVVNILRSVSLEEILRFLDEYINLEYEEYLEFCQRKSFIESIVLKKRQ